METEEETTVVHAVRFEVVTGRGEDGTSRTMGTWKIVDIDDVLDGNVFH